MYRPLRSHTVLTHYDISLDSVELVRRQAVVLAFVWALKP